MPHTPPQRAAENDKPLQCCRQATTTEKASKQMAEFRSIWEGLRITTETQHEQSLVGALDEHGDLGWLEDDRDDATAHFARKPWIAAMLHDTARNDAYGRAIAAAAAAVPQGSIALEVGAGTGLLTQLLCRETNLGHVVACEMEPALAEVATASVRQAVFSEQRCTIVAARSDAITLPTPASLVVCELADHGLLGEGLLPTLREVFASVTVAKDAIVIPCAAYVEAALFEDTTLAKRRGPDEWRRQRCAGGSISSPARLRKARRLTPYVRVLDLSFTSPPERGAHVGEAVAVQVERRGRVDGVGYRWRMELGFGESASNGEDAPAFQDHWWQMAQVVDRPFAIGPGVPLTLKAKHTDDAITFEVFFDAGFVTSASALCACGLHVGFSVQRLLSLPDDYRALAARCLRGDETAEVWDVGDGGICASSCLRAGCHSAVAWCADTRDALHASHVATRHGVALDIFSELAGVP